MYSFLTSLVVFLAFTKFKEVKKSIIRQFSAAFNGRFGFHCPSVVFSADFDQVNPPRAEEFRQSSSNYNGLKGTFYKC
jgi:hypothetical protein